jgi:hypothetical protein
MREAIANLAYATPYGPIPANFTLVRIAAYVFTPDKREVGSSTLPRQIQLRCSHFMCVAAFGLLALTGVSSHSTLGSNRLPPLDGMETNADNSPNQSAKWWAIDKSESPKPADVGVKRVTGSCVV